jgi:hypothetical protein
MFEVDAWYQHVKDAEKALALGRYEEATVHARLAQVLATIKVQDRLQDLSTECRLGGRSVE